MTGLPTCSTCVTSTTYEKVNVGSRWITNEHGNQVFEADCVELLYNLVCLHSG